MDRSGLRFSDALRRALVRARTLAHLSALAPFPVVVCLRLLCAVDLLDGWHHRGLEWRRRRTGRDRRVGLAGAAVEASYHLRICPLGDAARYRACGAPPVRWRLPRA